MVEEKQSLKTGIQWLNPDIAKYQQNTGYQQTYESISILPEKPQTLSVNSTTVSQNSLTCLFLAQFFCLKMTQMEPKPLSLFYEPPAYCMSQTKSQFSVGD